MTQAALARARTIGAATAGLGAALLAATPAHAADDEFELWLAPVVTVSLDDRHYVELDTAQRFRDAPAAETYQYRLWLGRKLGKDVTIAGGVERTIEGDRKETRLSEQIVYPLGPLRLRTRLEQRFFNDGDRTAWRIRQRVGHSWPLGSSKWKLNATAEGFVTLRAPSRGGQTGLTGIRTVLSVERDFDKLRLTLGYVRNQAVRKGAPDRVGHAPLIGLNFRL